MLTSTASSLFNMSAQASAYQAGQVSDISVVTFGMVRGFHFASAINVEPVGYGSLIEPPKSARELMQEQASIVIGALSEGLEQTAGALREVWRGMIERGLIEGDPEAAIRDIRAQVDESDEGLYSALRQMVDLHAEAEQSLLELHLKVMDMDRYMSRTEIAANAREFSMLVNRAIRDQVDAQMASEAIGGVDGSEGLQGAETALKLIWMMRGSPGQMAGMSESFAEMREAGRVTALLVRRNELIGEFKDRIEAGEITVSISKRSVWAGQEVSVDVAPGHMASVQVSQSYRMVAASFSASIGGETMSRLA